MSAKGLLYFLIGWAVPGLGHILQKKIGRGITFLLCIAGMTTLGLAMGGRIFPFQVENPLTILAFFADIGNGLIYLASRGWHIVIFKIQIFNSPAFGIGELKNVTYEFGTAFLAGAGLLNYLVALDAYDFGRGKKT